MKFETEYTKRLKQYIKNGNELTFDTEKGFALDTNDQELPFPPFSSLDALYDPSNWSNMIHYYPFNGNTDDVVGSNNLSAISSLGNFVSAIDQEGYEGDATTDEQLAGNVNTLPTNQITVAGWWKPDSIDVGGGGPFAAVDLNLGEPAVRIGNNSQSLAVNIRTSDNGVVGTSAQGDSLTAGSFQHVALTYDGSKLIGYFNGTQSVSFSATGTIDYTDVNQFGSTSSNSIDTVDEFAIFDTALSASEIDTLYQAGV